MNVMREHFANQIEPQSVFLPGPLNIALMVHNVAEIRMVVCSDGPILSPGGGNAPGGRLHRIHCALWRPYEASRGLLTILRRHFQKPSKSVRMLLEDKEMSRKASEHVKWVEGEQQSAPWPRGGTWTRDATGTKSLMEYMLCFSPC